MYLLRKAARQLQGRTEVHGLPISIENRRGSIRQWTDSATGEEGMTRMVFPYGYFTNGTLGSDGDALDCYVGPNRESRLVVIIHSMKAPTFTEYDEDKVMTGWDSVEEATAAYLKHFDDPRFFGSATVMDIDEFRATLPESKGEKITGGRQIEPYEVERAVKLSAPHGLEGFKKSHVETVTRRPTTRRTAHGMILVRNTTARVKKSDEKVKAAHEGISGKPEEELRAIAKERGIYVPPAWTDIWVNKDPRAGLQVKGRDKGGVLQRAYTKTHHDTQAVEKFERVKTFAKSYTKIMGEIEADLKTSEPAQILYLISKMGFRLGNEKERGEVKAYGASNLISSHIAVKGDTTIFAFIGKKGVPIFQKTKDPKIKEIVTGKKGKLFKQATPAAIRNYMTEIGYGDYLVKDFRTLLAMSIALKAVKAMPAPTDQKSYKKAVKAVCEKVADKLGNTAAVAKASYIPPEVFSKWTI